MKIAYKSAFFVKNAYKTTIFMKIAYEFGRSAKPSPFNTGGLSATLLQMEWMRKIGRVSSLGQLFQFFPSAVRRGELVLQFLQPSLVGG